MSSRFRDASPSREIDHVAPAKNETKSAVQAAPAKNETKSAV